MADAQPRLLAEPSSDAQEAIVRENVPDPLAGEQTWPTEEVQTTARWLHKSWRPAASGTCHPSRANFSAHHIFPSVDDCMIFDVCARGASVPRAFIHYGPSSWLMLQFWYGWMSSIPPGVKRQLPPYHGGWRMSTTASTPQSLG